MNKKRVNNYLPNAISVLKDVGIAVEQKSENNNAEKVYKIDSTYRASISGFGAAVIMGSFKAAVAFYAEDAKGDNPAKSNKIYRSKLLQAMYYIVNDGEYPKCKEGDKNFFPDNAKAPKEICKEIIELKASNEKEICAKWIDASIALKLAMSAYTLEKGKE